MANPSNVLSCIVTWTTDVESTSEVRFGEGEYQFVIRNETPTKEHRVVVIGMHAETAYMLQAASSTASGTGTLEDTFTTGKLPAQVVKGAATTFEAGALQDGWTLTNLMNNGPAVIVMYDMAGEPVWYYVNGDSSDQRGDVSADLVDGNHILIGPAPGEPPREIDLEGKIVWEGPAQGGDQMTHHAGKLSNGNYGVIRDVRDQGAGLQGSQVDEVSPENEVIWSWNIFDHLEPKQGSNTDWCHGNSVTFDFENDAVYLNCRFLGIIKIKYSTKDVVWGLGGTFDTTTLLADFAFTPGAGQFSDAHHPKYEANGNILMYDNGGFSQAGGFGGSAGSGFHSRAIEYAIDEAAGTATVVWEFPGDFSVDSWFTQDWYSPYWGDVDRLANGNMLIDGAIRSTSAQARIFEVDPTDGKVLWQMELPTNIGTYRAERLSPPPLVEAYTP
jgi:Arylsulfotransferase (ASST)